MREPLTQRVAAAVRTGERAPVTNPRRDLVSGSIAVRGGTIEFVRPRDAIELLWEQDFDAEGDYPPYWAELWPSGVELAYAVSTRKLGGAHVVELGCGLGLPSIAASLGGGRVLATDRTSDATEATAENARRSAAVVETAVCSWAEPDVIVDRAPWDLVLASDVLYEPRNASGLLDLLPRLVNDSSEVWIADPGRPLVDDFLAAARARWRKVSTNITRNPSVRIHRLRGLRRRPGAGACPQGE
jgi:predicted nicotinamide N-methyase